MIHYPSAMERLVSNILSSPELKSLNFRHSRTNEFAESARHLIWDALHEAMEEMAFFHNPMSPMEPLASAEEMRLECEFLRWAAISDEWSLPFKVNRQAISLTGRSKSSLDNPIPKASSLRSGINEFMTEARSPGLGAWWSHPSSLMTSGAWGSLPATELLGNEDDSSTESATVIPVVAEEHSLSVYEVDSLSDWVALVDLAPANVTASRKDYWGIYEPGQRWELPNWNKVSEQFDAVHLTVNGYLDSSCVPTDTASGARTLLAGWGPDVTCWLRSPRLVLGEPFTVSRTGPASWRRDQF